MIISDMLKGGIPAGQLMMFCARSSCSDGEWGPKSSIMLTLIKEAIDRGDKVLYLNLEGSIDPAALSAMGINKLEK